MKRKGSGCRRLPRAPWESRRHRPRPGACAAASAALSWVLVLWWFLLWGRPRRKPYPAALLSHGAVGCPVPPGRADGTALVLERARQRPRPCRGCWCCGGRCCGYGPEENPTMPHCFPWCRRLPRAPRESRRHRSRPGACAAASAALSWVLVLWLVLMFWWFLLWGRVLFRVLVLHLGMAAEK